MRKYILLLLCCLSIYTSSAQVELSDSEIVTFKTEVAKITANTTTIVSNFAQYKHLSFLNNDIKTEGHLVFKAPDAIRWEYTSPYQYVAIFKNNTIKIDDDGNKSQINLNASKLFKSLNQLIINSVKGNMFNPNEFSITYFKIDTAYLVKFVPKDENVRQFISVFELQFDSSSYDVTEVKMIEPSEDYTKIVFSNKMLNTKVDDAIFNN